jgi:hypothetical protein
MFVSFQKKIETKVVHFASVLNTILLSKPLFTFVLIQTLFVKTYQYMYIIKAPNSLTHRYDRVSQKF